MDEYPEFPVSPPAFDGASRVVDPGACFDWLRQGWVGFSANPGVWIACAVLAMIIFFGLSIVPIAGQLAANLLVPVIGAGFLHIARRQGREEDIEIDDLFVGFRHNAGGLVMVGVFYMLSILAMAFVVMVVAGGGFLGGMMMGPRSGGMGFVLGGAMLALLLVTALMVPVMMAIWFAPALVFFHNMEPLEALKASFSACAKNWLPFLVYGVLLLVLFFFAALPLGLGFLVLIPVLAGAQYASYRDVFAGV